MKLESRKTLDLVQFVDDDDIEAMYFEKPYYVVPADDLAEEAYVVLRDALQGREEDRRRPARDARPGICRGDQTVRARNDDGDAPLRRRGQQEHRLLPRHRRSQARPRPARHGLDADRAQSRRIQSGRVPQSLRRCAPASSSRKSRSRRARRSSRIRTPTRAPPKGSNVIDLMAALKKSLGDDKSGKGSKPKKATAKKAEPKKAPAKTAARKTGVNHGSRERRSTSIPTTVSATSRRRRSRRAAS